MRSTTLRSSRTLPGQGRRSSHAIAFSVKRSFRGQLGGERGDELGDVLAALRQRRHVERHDVEPVVEVLAEAALGDASLQVDVRRREDARLERALLLGAERPEATVFEHAQELRLEIDRHLGDLVEKHACRRPRARAGRACAARRR